MICVVGWIYAYKLWFIDRRCWISRGMPGDLFLEAEFPGLSLESLFLALALQFHSELHWERERKEKVHFPQAQNSRGKQSIKSFPHRGIWAHRHKSQGWSAFQLGGKLRNYFSSYPVYFRINKWQGGLLWSLYFGSEFKLELKHFWEEHVCLFLNIFQRTGLYEILGYGNDLFQTSNMNIPCFILKLFTLCSFSACF